jgi:hypothetical protein
VLLWVYIWAARCAPHLAGVAPHGYTAQKRKACAELCLAAGLQERWGQQGQRVEVVEGHILCKRLLQAGETR